jgi:hypothetical protein
MSSRPYRGSGGRMPTLGKLIAQPMADEFAPILTFQQKVDRWMINEGGFIAINLTTRESENICYRIYPCPRYGVFIWLYELQHEGIGYIVRLTSGQFDTSSSDFRNHLSYSPCCGVNAAHGRRFHPFSYILPLRSDT